MFVRESNCVNDIVWSGDMVYEKCREKKSEYSSAEVLENKKRAAVTRTDKARNEEVR